MKYKLKKTEIVSGPVFTAKYFMYILRETNTNNFPYTYTAHFSIVKMEIMYGCTVHCTTTQLFGEKSSFSNDSHANDIYQYEILLKLLLSLYDF